MFVHSERNVAAPAAWAAFVVAAGLVHHGEVVAEVAIV
jgi:hypothetical protein